MLDFVEGGCIAIVVAVVVACGRWRGLSTRKPALRSAPGHKVSRLGVRLAFASRVLPGAARVTQPTKDGVVYGRPEPSILRA